MRLNTAQGWKQALGGTGMCYLAFHSRKKTINALAYGGLVVVIKLLIAQINAGCKRAKPKPSPGKPL